VHYNKGHQAGAQNEEGEKKHHGFFEWRMLMASFERRKLMASSDQDRLICESLSS
jgi:hypothetical protein